MSDAAAADVGTLYRKHTLVHGAGPPPRVGAVLALTYELFASHAEAEPAFESSRAHSGAADGVYVMHAGLGTHAPIMEHALATMRAGERARVLCDVADGDAQRLPIMAYELHLVAIGTRFALHVPPLLSSERLTFAEQQRAGGNRAFQAGDVDGALRQYTLAARALRLPIGGGSATHAADAADEESGSMCEEDEVGEQADAASLDDDRAAFAGWGMDDQPLRLPDDAACDAAAENECACAVLLNMGACFIQTQQAQASRGADEIDWASRALGCCELVLARDASRAKAWYRQGQAHLLLNNFDLAHAALERARELAPQDRAIEKELLAVEKAQARADSTEKRLYQAMLG